MAKTLGPKSRLIRQAITDNPDKGNTELAHMLSAAKERKDDKIKVTPQDIAQQRQAMKKAGALPTTGKKRGRPRKAAQPTERPRALTPRTASPIPAADVFTHIEAVKEAVKQLGAEQVSRIVRLFE